MTVRRGGSWRPPISFGTSVGNLPLWMSVSLYSSIRNPRFWLGYCVYMWMICCWVAVVQPIRFANGREIKENSVVATFPRMFSPKRPLCHNTEGAGARALGDAGHSQGTYRTYCKSRKVLPPPKGGERAASMLRCPARSDYLVSLENGSESNRRRTTFVPRILHSEQSSNRSLQVERVSLIAGQSGRVNLLSSWFMNLVQTKRLWKTSM